MRQTLSSCTAQVQTTGSQLFVLAVRSKSRMQEPAVNWAPGCRERAPVRFLKKEQAVKEGWPPTGQELAARRSFCWGGEEGGPPDPPQGQRGVGGERGGPASRSPRRRRGGHKEFGKRRAAGRRRSFPHPPFYKPLRNSRPGPPNRRRRQAPRAP